ncbi:unnamed protein product, partial [Sphacelaria rigidula]
GFKKKKVKCPSLRGCPQKKRVCFKFIICSPRKPNSGRRKDTKVRLSDEIKSTAYIPGQAHNLQERSQVLVPGGRIPDLPGVKYRLTLLRLELSNKGFTMYS